MADVLRLVLFGPPGAGKGTQAQLLKEQLNVEHISSGDLFRHHLRRQTVLGQRAAEYINQGLLVPDEITIDIMLEQALGRPTGEGFLLDGFPRNAKQAEALEAALQQQDKALDRVIYINVPEAELLRRLGGRYTCSQCQSPYNGTDRDGNPPTTCPRCGGNLYQREDDKPEAVQRRIQVFQDETLPLLEFYRKRNLLAHISGVGSVEAVNQRILEALGLNYASPD